MREAPEDHRRADLDELASKEFGNLIAEGLEQGYLAGEKVRGAYVGSRRNVYAGA